MREIKHLTKKRIGLAIASRLIRRCVPIQGTRDRLRMRPLTVLFGFLAFLVLPSMVDAADWRDVDQLSDSRSEISAVAVGDSIIVAGGIGRFRTLSSCEIYIRHSDEWAACPPLPRALHHVALASDGTDVYASGGYSNLLFSHDRTKKLLKLNLDSGVWMEIDDIPEPIGEHAMVYSNGNLYIVSGRSEGVESGRLWSYSLDERNWSQLESHPQPKHSFASLVIDEEIWIIGGRNELAGSKLRTSHRYSIPEDEWMTGPDIPLGGGGLFVAHFGSEIHILGGESFSPNQVHDQHQVYDLVKDQWSESVRPAGPRHGGAAVVLGKELYLIGGATKAGLRTVFSTTARVQVLPLRLGQ